MSMVPPERSIRVGAEDSMIIMKPLLLNHPPAEPVSLDDEDRYEHHRADEQDLFQPVDVADEPRDRVGEEVADPPEQPHPDQAAQQRQRGETKEAEVREPAEDRGRRAK